MKLIKKLIKPVYAHCDLPCGIYDPAQARIEAESILRINQKYEDQDEQNKWRSVIIKEQRAELVKHHLWVLWTDYFKPEHLQDHPDLHDLFWRATKAAGYVKKTTEVAAAQELLDLVLEVDKVFQATR